MRIVVVGGLGNFGERICRALASDKDIEVLPAGRSVDPDKGIRLDMASPDFPPALKRCAPQLVIHCAGPFQGQDYRVATASLAAGAHYIDLSDGREFVARFSANMDTSARAAGVLAMSGASTLPALSCAVIDSLRERFRQIETIQIYIAPGQRAPRGTATIAGVFSYAGKPFKWLNDGAWVDAWGWQELQRVRFAGFGSRWAAACDVPDLELLPERYPGTKTVEFRAALELGIQHCALWSVAALRRCGVPIPLERWARPLNKVATFLDRFGGDYGGMLVRLMGVGENGSRKRVEWHLTAPATHGPEIPTMAAILLARRLVRGEISARGAYACMGFLKLTDFEPEFAKWGISSLVEEGAA